MSEQVLVESNSSPDHVTTIECLLPVRAFQALNGRSELSLRVLERFFFGFVHLRRVLFNQVAQALRRVELRLAAWFLLCLRNERLLKIFDHSLLGSPAIRPRSNRSIGWVRTSSVAITLSLF